MKNSKKRISMFIIASIITVSLVGCGTSGSNSTSQGNSNNTTQGTPPGKPPSGSNGTTFVTGTAAYA